MLQNIKIKDYALLIKLKLSLLVLCSTLVGFWLASVGNFNVEKFLKLGLGTFLIIASANAFNEILERKPDGLMRRTASRPLPAGRMSVAEAFTAGILTLVLGESILFFFIDWRVALLAAMAFVIYVFAYTPLKKVTPCCVLIGALPGAIPAMMGPLAFYHHLTFLSWFLFGIVFLWQFPHFCAIAWISKEEYRQAGFKVLFLPENGRFTAYQVLLFSSALLGAAPLLTLMHQAGTYYFLGSFLLGLFLLMYAFLFWFKLSILLARQLMGMAMLYLPLLFALMILDKVNVVW